jgi:hypothetical protein
LKLLGLTQTAAALENSFIFPIVHPPHHPFSQLLHHLERGVVNADRFWSLLMPTPGVPSDSALVRRQLSTQLSATLGVRFGQTSDSRPLTEETEEELRGMQVDDDPKSPMPTRGTINQLVWAAATRYRNLSQTFVDVFAMTYHGFVSSSQMLTKLQQAWELIIRNNAQADDNVKDRAELLFVVLIEKWVEISFFDFDTALLQDISQWLDKIEPNRQSTKKRMLAALHKQMEGMKGDQRIEASLEGVVLPPNLFVASFTLTSVSVGELARQITMCSGHYYYRITPKELLDCAWSKSTIRHRAPNVAALANRFNVLGDWVASEILNASTIARRLQLIEYFAELGIILWQMSNFFDGLAIASAMNSNAIYRLKNHKAALPPNVWQNVQEILDESKSDNSFADLIHRHEVAQKKGQAIPYIGVYLTQLTFCYDGNPDYIDGLVNFSKCVLISKIIDRILSFQTKQFTFVIIEQIQQKLRDLPKLEESALFAKSLQVERNKLDKADFQAMMDAEARGS